MSIATAIQNAQTKVGAAYSAVSTRGGTLPATQNLSNLPTAINSIPSGGGGLQLTRFKDDTNTEIGTHYMNFTDVNGNEYKVILLDAQFRELSEAYCSNASAITDMPFYSDLKTSNVFEAKETATQNTQLILDYCAANGYTSGACSHCRNQSFVIGGITYYGQLPNMLEVINIAEHFNEFDPIDTSASSAYRTSFRMSRTIWSSSQPSSSSAHLLYSDSRVQFTSKATTNFVCPVLEIPVN